MKSLIEGRVVDSKGHPVEGARVTLDKSFRPESGDDWPLLDTRTDATGAYSFGGEEVEKLRERLDHSLAVRAFDDRRASRKVELVWSEWPLRASNLVVQSATSVRVEVCWEDGRPVRGAEVYLLISEPHKEDVIVSFLCETDDTGVALFGSVPDVKYVGWFFCKHLEAAPISESFKAKRVRKAIRIAMVRTRSVGGRLLTNDGQPAVRFRVAPTSVASGGPSPEQVVETDADGRFEVGGIDPVGGAIAVYCAVPSEPEDAGERFVHVMAYGGTPLNPVLVREVGRRENDLLEVVLPRLGPLVVRLNGADGTPACGGEVFWLLAGVHLGATAAQVDAGGTVRFECVPQDQPLEFRVTAIDANLGELRDEFLVDRVLDGEVVHQVAGAGTVILKLEANDGRPVAVPCVTVKPLGGLGTGVGEGVASEFRGWASPGVYSEFRVKAPGYTPCILRKVTVRDDGPTYLTARLEPLE